MNLITATKKVVMEWIIGSTYRVNRTRDIMITKTILCMKLISLAH